MARNPVGGVAGVLVAWLAAAFGLPCVALDLEPRLGGNLAPGGLAVEVAVSGNYAYVVVRDSGLQIFDISDPTHPRPVSGYRTSGLAVDVAISGNYAYLASERRPPNLGGGLDVINITDPTNPQRVGGYTGRDSKAVSVFGDYAYVAERTRLNRIDVGDPANPVMVSPLTISDPFAVAVSGDYAYVAQLNTGFQVFDISDPSSPGLIGVYATNGNFQDITISGNYAYVADQASGLHIVDISNPANPQLVGKYISSARKVAVAGSYAYVAAQPRLIDTNDVPGGLHIVDISDPANAQLVGRYDGVTIVQGVATAGNHACVVDGRALTVIDIADATVPRRAGSYFVQAEANDVALSGSYAYVADGFAGLEIFDITQVAGGGRAECVGGFFIGSPANSVAVAGNYAFLLSTGTLHIIDIVNPADPRRVAKYESGDDARNVTIAGSVAYVAGKAWTNGVGGGLHIVDISDPANPRLRGRYTRSNAVDVALSGNYAHLTVEPHWHDGRIQVNGALEVLDISNPATPNLLGRYVTSNHTQGVAVSGDYAYVGDGQAGLHVINVANPAKPERVGTFTSTAYINPSIIGGYVDGAFTSVTVVSNHCYAAEFFLHFSHGVWPLGSSVQIIDISDPSDPKRVGSARIGEYDDSRPYEFGSHAQGMVLSGKHLFVAGSKAGLQVMDIRSPAPSQVVGDYNPGSAGPGMAISGNYLYLAAQRRWTGSNFIGGGVEVIDIGNPANPHFSGAYTNDDFSEIAVSGANACVVAGSSSLRLLDISDPINPKPVGTYNAGALFVKVALAGNYAYVTATPNSGRGGLHVIDISNRASPQPAGRYDSGGYAFGLVLSGRYVYMSQGPRLSGTSNVLGGLQIIDINSPANPQPVGAYATSGWGRGVAIAGNYAYLAGEGIGLHVIDISNPANPQRVGENNAIGNTEAVAVSGNYAYVMDAEARLHVFDIRDPANPKRVGANTSFTAFFGEVPSVATISAGKLFVRTAAQGLFILHHYQPIRLYPVAPPDQGSLRMQITGPPGVPGRVQRSGDLLNWTDWLPVNFGEAPLEISDGASATAQFYRVAVP
jgi:hypothetical protein